MTLSLYFWSAVAFFHRYRRRRPKALVEQNEMDALGATQQSWSSPAERRRPTKKIPMGRVVRVKLC